LLAIREQGGVRLDDGTTVFPEPILVGRSEERLRAIAERHGLERWTTDLDEVLADPAVDVYFDAQVTSAREASLMRAIEAGKHVYTEKPVAGSLEGALRLARAAKAWAAGELPRHRGRGASRVRAKVNALARLSESLRARGDHGMTPASLGRPDIEAFLARLAYLESAGTISRYHRNVICRGARTVLAGIRGMGLTRPGQAAAGLPGDFMIGRGDIPADPERGEPGRDLPPEIMAALCASLDSLQPAEARTAIQIAIDTGRRPEDILGLPLDCLARDADGAPVLVYDNLKAHRLGRRLPVSEATATVITSQQARVRARFPATPVSELKLLPAPRANPGGRKPITISMLDDRHQLWVAGLGTLRTRDGREFDKARAVPYAYRHSHAQRHADAGVPIDVLAELLDHRNLNVTRRYYRNSRELHQTGAFALVA